MSGGAQKFTFDEEFGTEGGRSSRNRAQEQSRLDDAEQQGYFRGQIEGRRETEQEAAMRAAVALEKVAAAAAAILARLDSETARFETVASTLALAFARKLAGDIALRAPLAALESAAADCFRQLVGVPHVVVRIEQEMIDQAKTKLDRMARERGYEGRIVVLGEPGLALGDFVIEWADGGMIRDSAALAAMIAGAVERHVADDASAAVNGQD
jgi:flagellar assembly protein FliH